MKWRYRIALIVIAIALGGCLMLLQSYALWVVTLTGETNIIEVGCFNIDLTEDTSSISLTNTYPVSDTKGLTQTPYTFTITNTCEVAASYMVTLNTLTTNGIGIDDIKFAFGTTIPTAGTNLGTYASTASNVNTETEDLSIANLDTSIILGNGTLAVDGSITYYLYLWIDYDASNDVMGRSFAASVDVVSTATTISE